MAQIVVVGDGQVNRRQVLTVLDKVVKKHGGDVEFIVPVGGVEDSEIPPMLNHLVSFVLRQDDTLDVRITVVRPEGLEITEESAIDEAMTAKRLTVVDSTAERAPLATAIAMAPKAAVVFAVWDDEDPQCAEALRLASAKGLTVRDLTDERLAKIEIDEDGEDDTPNEEVVQKPKRSEGVKSNPEASVTIDRPDPFHAVEAALRDLVAGLADVVADRAMDLLIERSAKGD